MLQKFNVVLSLLVCLLLAALVVVILLGDKIFPEPKTAEKVVEAKILTVEIAKAQPSAMYSVHRTYTGVVRAKQSVELGFSRAGRIAEMLVDTGDRVSEGDPLAKLEMERLEKQKKKIKNSLNQRSGPTQADLDRVEAELEDSVLSAPFDGVISEKRMTVGSLASPGVGVFKIDQEDELEAWIAIPVDVAGEISKEKKQTLQIGGEKFETELETILPDVDLTTRTRTAVFALDKKSSADYLPGESVMMELEREVKSDPLGFWLPLTALTRETRGLWSVYGINREGESPVVVRNFVEVIHVDGDRAWVRGTPAGEFEFIPTGVSRVVPGQIVKVKGDPEPVAEEEPEKVVEKVQEVEQEQKKENEAKEEAL